MEGKKFWLNCSLACSGGCDSTHQAWSFLSLIFTMGRREEKRSGFCFSLFGYSEVRAVNVLNLNSCLMVIDYQKSLCIDLSQLVWEQFTVLQNGGQNTYVLGEGSLRENRPLISLNFSSV